MAQSGPKYKYTPELADEVVAGIASGLTDQDAAIAAGVSSDTFGRWMRAERGAPAELAARITRARAQRSRMWLGGIRRAAEQGDWRAYAELLDRCSPDYRKSTKIEHSGTIALPPAEVAKIARDWAAENGQDEADAVAAAERLIAERQR